MIHKSLPQAKAKADDIEARLHAGGDFSQLARSFSEGTTAAEGGDLGQYKKGQLDPLFEQKTFALKTGDVTEPIRTKQGFVILKVIQHVPGGVPQLKDVENDVEQNYFEAKAGPAMRRYLGELRDESAIYIKPGYEDSAATAAEKHPSITFSAYTPPAPKKKRKVERTRFRETTHSFRQKSGRGCRGTVNCHGDRAGKFRNGEHHQQKHGPGFDEARQEGEDPLWQSSAGDFTAGSFEPD